MRSIARSFLAALFALAVTIPVPGLAEQAPAPMARAPINQPALKQAPEAQTRSAQGDCVREANRRGFTVLDTSNFQQFQGGWSIDLRVRNQRGQVTNGSCFVETRTGDVNLYGFGWGYDDEGDDRMQFNCASVDMKYRECQLPVNGRAVLVQRLSDARCVEGQSWGQRGDRVWVANGCRARFEVTRTGWGGGTNVVDCNSDGGRYRECAIGAGYFGRLLRDNSNGRCRENSTWGTRNGVIWVTDGCRGRFEKVRGNAGGNSQNFFDCRSPDGRYQECSIGRGNSARIVREYSSGRCRPGATWGIRDDVVWVTNGCMAQFERTGSGNSSGAGQSQAAQACVSEVQRRGGRILQQDTAVATSGGYRMQMRVRMPTGETRTVGCTYSAQSRQVRLEVLSGT
ncbi:MAG: DUF3011 domain-containing protein [Steroidobacteraceae bacterium]